MKKFSFLILLIFSSNLFAQTNHKSILYLKAETKQLIENSLSLPDSINSIRIQYKKHSVGNIIVQSLGGTFFGIGTSLFTGAVVLSASLNSNNETIPKLSFYTLVPATLIFGSAIGVHLIARQENPKHSFWQTVKYSSYGAGSGFVISLIIASSSKKVSGGEVVFIALTPLIGSLIYSNFIADWPETNTKNKLNNASFRKINYSFKDYYDSQQLFKVNIISIPF